MGSVAPSCDDFALASHAKAAHAQDDGYFDDQILPIVLANGTKIARDEGIRRGGTPETLAGIKTAFSDTGVVTAGNSSQISDGSAALLMMTSEKARSWG